VAPGAQGVRPTVDRRRYRLHLDAHSAQEGGGPQGRLRPTQAVGARPSWP
jgi:hypothetical protein